jgi:ParB family chromosome partitioning protein
MSRNLLDLPIDRISCVPQVRERFSEESLAGLAANLGEAGLLQPILVKPAGDGWVVIDGERRLRAARKAGWSSVPAIVDEAADRTAETLWQQMAANLQREDLSPMESARGIDRLMKEARWSAAQVAQKLGMSPASVSKLLALLVLPKEIQDQVHAGQVAASTAYEIAKVRDPKKRAQLSEDATNGRLTRDRAARHSKTARRKRSPDSARRAGSNSEAVIMLAGGRSVKVAGPGLTAITFVVWLEELLERARRVDTQAIDLGTLARAISSEQE